MMRTISVPISAPALDRLRDRAERERRRPQDEAAVLLERALDVVDEHSAAVPVGSRSVEVTVEA